MKHRTPTATMAYHGSAAPLENPVFLRAGALSLTYCDGAIRSVMAGEVEIVRRIYVAVRDKFWNTAPFALSNFRLRKGTTSFTIVFDCSHIRDKIDFFWHARIDGKEDGTLSFSLHGESRSSFETNRVGFCVLHPLAECSGKPCAVEFTNGKRMRDRFPDAISPHQPFRNMRALFQRFGAHMASELRFEGETFEMEDQRNWTDASFKTYCPPLSLSIPRTVQKGETLLQSIVLRVTGAPGSAKKDREEKPLPFEFESKAVPIPDVGIAIAGSAHRLGGREAELLKACNFSHVRADVSLDNPAAENELEYAATCAARMNAPLELALHFRKQSLFLRKDTLHIRKLLDSRQPRLRRLLVFRRGEKVTYPDTLSAVREILGEGTPCGDIVTGTNGYFVEINRNPPMLDGASGICYSVNPQVHTFDDTAIIENLVGLAATVATARKRVSGANIFVTPVTLGPRLNPESPQKDHGADPRQKSLLGAVWTLGSIMRLSQGGASGITYFETSGDCGVMDRGGRRVFPMYHVFADVGEFAGGTIRFPANVGTRDLAGCALELDGKKRFLVANMTPASKNVFLRGLPRTVHRVRLNATTFERACGRPAEFRTEKRIVRADRGSMRIRMLPYEIVRLDAEE